MNKRIRSHSRRVCRLWHTDAGPARNSGMALIFVLWIVVLLTAIAFQMSYRGQLRARITATTGDATQAYFLARSGVEMAISDLVENATSAADQAALRGDAARLYGNITLGNGAYTLLASAGQRGTTFGLIDECGKLNINTATAGMLGRLTILESGMAEAIIALREEEESFPDLDALLLIDGLDRLDLYGEDQNGNGLLDSNEDDGDQSWPPDNADGALDGGLADYLTAWSSARDVDTTGAERVKLAEATAEEIVAALPEITQQQADSIVHHREQNAFSSILDLLDVKLIEKVKNDGQGGENPEGGNRNPQQGQPAPQNPQGQEQRQDQQAREEGTGDQQGDGAQTGEQGTPEETAERERDADAEAKKKQEEGQYTVQETGQKAFDEETFKKLADRVTIEEDELVAGRINVNTASVAVLACLPDIDESIALAIVQDRQGRLDGFGTAFDLLEVRGIDQARLKGILGHICVRSDVFSVRSFGVLHDGRTVVSVSAVLDRTGDEVRILNWREHG